LRASAPATRVVLNCARGVTRCRGFAPRGGVFAAATVKQLNDRRAQLEAVFLEADPAESIDPMVGGAVSDADHPCGAGAAHYEQSVYERFRTQLRRIAGVEVTATREPSPQSAPGA